MVTLRPGSLSRVVRAVEKVRDRLLRVTAVLEAEGIPDAVCGGNPVAAWVLRVDETAVRNTQNVDLLMRECDVELAKASLAMAGFQHANAAGVEMVLNGIDGRPRDAVPIVIANHKVRPEYFEPSPDVEPFEYDVAQAFRHMALESLVRMTKTSDYTTERMHILDLIDIGLIDSPWPKRFPPSLADRLQQLLDNPED
jgi:hypothetical protein